MSDLNSLLEFWLGSCDPDQMITHRPEWWMKDDEFDRRINEEFASLYESAAKGELDNWKDTAIGCLGLVVLLDQFPRNMFRGEPRAFATDEAARNITRHALDQGFDQQLGLSGKLFLYLPLEHSENLDHQSACVALMQAMGDEGYLDYALKHQAVIEKFGRFPHRNEVLGRESTPEELDYLAQPGSGF